MSGRGRDLTARYLGVLMDVARAVQGVEPGKTIAVDLDGLVDDVRQLRAELDLARAKLALRDRAVSR